MFYIHLGIFESKDPLQNGTIKLSLSEVLKSALKNIIFAFTIASHKSLEIIKLWKFFLQWLRSSLMC